MAGSVIKRLSFVLGALSLFAAALPLGCSEQPCDPSLLRCGKDGKLHCGIVPASVGELPRECCAASEPAPADAGSAGDDAGEAADAGSAGSAGDDAGEVADAGGAAVDAGESCGDAEVPEPPDGGWPTGTDDLGLAYLYRCGVDLCHPGTLPSADGGVPADAGDAGDDPVQCGPLGCN